MDPTYPLDTIRAVQAQVAAAQQDLAEAMQESPIQMERVKAAIARGADLQAFGECTRVHRETSALIEAVRQNSPDLLQFLLAQGFPAEPHPSENDDLPRTRTPLWEAARLNRAWAIPALIEAGALFEKEIDEVTSGALEAALENDADDAVEALLAAGANPNLNTDFSDEAYICLARTERSMRAMVAAGANIHWSSIILGTCAVAGGLLSKHPQEKEEAPEALRAFVELGGKLPKDALFLAAQSGLPRTLTLLDSLGLNWFARRHYMSRTRSEQLRTPLDVLKSEHPPLWEHWSRVIQSRGQSKRLSNTIPTKKTTGNSRPRL